MPNFASEVAQIGSKWPIWVNFQVFPQKVAQIFTEWPILPNSQLFISFPRETAQNHLERPILPNSQLFQSFPTEAAQNHLECTPWTHFDRLGKMHPVMKVACRLVEIALRYLSFLAVLITA